MYGGTSRFESSFTGASTVLESCQIFCSIISDSSYETWRLISSAKGIIGFYCPAQTSSWFLTENVYAHIEQLTNRNITACLLVVRHLFVLLYCRVLTCSSKFQHNLIILLDTITFKTTWFSMENRYMSTQLNDPGHNDESD